MRRGARSLYSDSIDRRPKRARHVDPSPFRFRRCLALPSSQTACSAEFVEHRLPLGLRPFGTFAIPGAIRHIEFGVEFGQAATVRDGSIVWTSRLPAGSNATLAISGNTLLAGAGLPLNATQHAVVVAYQLGAG
jgi:hypothetical protein